MKNLIGYFAIIFITLIFSGCSKQLKPTVVYIPELNKIAIAEIGQNMYEKVYAVYPSKEAVKFLDTESIARFGNGANYFKKLKSSECVMLLLSNKGSLYVKLRDKNCDGEFTVVERTFLFENTTLNKPIKYKIIPATPTKIINSASKYVVLYQGRVGNKLNIAFQSFVSVLGKFKIKEGFTQNIQYELDENGEALIGFKGLRIKVLRATNFDIIYQVISDYN